MDNQILKNRVDCMNRVHNYINIIAPLLQKELNKGFKVKNNNCEFFEKDKERFNIIIESTPIFRVFVKITKYDITLQVDDNYISTLPDKNGVSICTYYKQYVYLFDRQNNKMYDFQPLKTISADDILQTEKKLEELENQKREIGYQIAELKSFLNI